MFRWYQDITTCKRRIRNQQFLMLVLIGVTLPRPLLYSWAQVVNIILLSI